MLMIFHSDFYIYLSVYFMSHNINLKSYTVTIKFAVLSSYFITPWLFTVNCCPSYTVLLSGLPLRISSPIGLAGHRLSFFVLFVNSYILVKCGILRWLLFSFVAHVIRRIVILYRSLRIEYLNPLTPTVKAIWVQPSFVIFDIRALWRSGLSLSVRMSVPGCQKLQMTA